MISVADARARILAGLRPVAAETVAISEAWGRVLARPVLARLDQPPADLSAMDGYALRAVDGGQGSVLPIAGSAPAGRPFGSVLPAGSALRLFTGSVIPTGADSVVIQEEVAREDDRITLQVAAVAGQHIRRRGQDFSTGETLLQPGRRLTARDVALAAAANHPWLTVHRRPRIAVLATGDEIVLPGEAVPAGGIVSSNSLALAAIIRAAGGEPVLLPIAGDDAVAIAGAVDQLGGCDMLVTSGGASVGDHDLVQSALGSRGLQLDFWKIAMRPGKPLMHGQVEGAGGLVPMIGLPGNPVSAIVCATLFLQPAIAALAGEDGGGRPPQRHPLGLPLPANDRREDYLRGRLAQDGHGTTVAVPFRSQGSHLLRGLAEATILIVRPPYAAAAAAGELVDTLILDDCHR